MDLPPALLDSARHGQIGQVVRLARRRLGYTQAQLATALGYSQTAVSRIERGAGGNAYDVRTLRTLARVLEIPASMLGLSDSPSEENNNVQRRDFMRVTAAAAALAAGDLITPGRIAQSDIAEMQKTIDDLRALDQQTGSPMAHTARTPLSA